MREFNFVKSLLIGFSICFVVNTVQADINGFEKNPYFSRETRDKIRPYLITKKHPMKERLDKIFQSTRASFNDESLIKAGFSIKFRQPRSFIYVVSHKSLPGYLLKLVPDVEHRQKSHKPEWHWFVNRCRGVEKIHQVLNKHHIKYFTAPKKWIYPLPVKPYPSKGARGFRKLVVLLVEDMQLTSKQENLNAWKTEITRAHLNELFLIIKEVGGHSYRAQNIPQTKKGTFAFVDTEYPTSPPSYGDIKKYLSRRRQVYWESLLRRK